MRKYYIDNLRIICILLLFPFHAAMCFNAFGESFYVNGEPSRALTMIVVGTYPWWMSLLFALAGVSTMYALKKRSAAKYARERLLRLLIPLLFGLLLVIPPQTYIADVFHNGCTDGYFEHYAKFFGTITDFGGYDGAFTPGNLWFILYLLVISLVTLPLTSWYASRGKKLNFGKINLAVLIAAGVPLLCAASYVLDIGGKSVGENLCCFLLGFFALSDDEMMEKLKKRSFVLGALWLILIIARLLMYGFSLPDENIAWGVEYRALELVGILAATGLGARFLDRKFRLTSYLAAAEFPLYICHQTVLVAVAFFVVSFLAVNKFVQFAVIVLLSLALTLGVYELIKRTPVTRFMFGIKPSGKKRGQTERTAQYEKA